jgi:hypothetical protein
MSTYQTDQQRAWRRFHPRRRAPDPAPEADPSPAADTDAAPEAPTLPPPIDPATAAHAPGGIRETLHDLFG